MQATDIFLIQVIYDKQSNNIFFQSILATESGSIFELD